MKKLFLAILILYSSFSLAQDITLKDIYQSSKFRAVSGPDIYFSQIDDKHYLSLEEEGNDYVLKKTSIKKDKEGEILFRYAKNNSKGIKLQMKVSPDEKYILAFSDKKNIYRYSSKAYYYIIDLATKQVISINSNKISCPDFSPDSRKIAYVYENNLYYYDIENRRTVQVTKDGKKGSIINGVGDWVYQEELDLIQAYKWSPEGDKIAFYSFNENEVPKFSFNIYEDNAFYPKQVTIAYPKVAAPLPTISLKIYDVESRDTSKIEFSRCCEFYVPFIKWLAGTSSLFFVKLNREQDNVEFDVYSTSTKEISNVFSEETKRYFYYFNAQDFHFNSRDKNLVFIKPDKRGTQQVFRLDVPNRQIYQVTTGNMDATKVYAVNEKSQIAYFQQSSQDGLYRSLKGVRYRTGYVFSNHDELSFYDAQFRSDGEYYILQTSDWENPPTRTMFKYTGRELKNISSNEALKQKVDELNLSPMEFSTVEGNGFSYNTFMVKPRDFNPNKKYPVIVYVYGGPGSQVVSKRWSISQRLLAQYFANQGFIYAAMDGRGTGYKGGAMRQAVLKNLGIAEAEDQNMFARTLAKNKWVDANRIGIWGWSYGGYMAGMSIMMHDTAFKCAVSVAPVTDWRFYDATYTERYMGLYSFNLKGYEKSSLLNRVKDLHGDYLLIHGLADDNVHFQNSAKLSEKLIMAGKQFEQAYYPNQNHSINKNGARVHIMQRIANFFNQKLKR